MADTPSSPPRFAALRDKLLESPSAVARTEAATEVAGEFAAGDMTEKERDIALQILETLARDVEHQVREALAEQVKSCPTLPAALARTLAEDVESVALPVIRYSPVLSEADLVALVRRGSPTKQIAIARRDQVTPQVADALVDSGHPIVVTSLLENPGATLSEGSLHKVIDRFEGDEAVEHLLVKRATLPLAVTDRLIRTVSDALRVHLIDRHGLPWDFARELANQAGEGALVHRMIADPSVSEVERLVAGLHAQGKLTPTLLLRALGMGDNHFFEAAVATLAGIRVENAVQLIHDRGPLGFKAVYGKAGLPPELMRAFHAAIAVIEEVKDRRGESWGAPHTQLLIDRVMAEYPVVRPEGLDQLLSQLSFHAGGHPASTLPGS